MHSPSCVQVPLQRMLPCRGLGWRVRSTALHPLPFGNLAAVCGHSATVGTKGFGGCEVMLEAGAHRCLLTMVPLHIHAKGLSQVCTGSVTNLETTWLCLGGQKGEAVDSPLFFVLLLWCTWQLLQTTTIAWLRHGSNAECSLQQLRVALTDSCFLCSDKPRGIPPQQL